jgi:hypothetical protein
MKKSNDMAYRPYFKHGIEQIQELVASSRDDLKALKVIQDELGFRNRPKAHVLKVEVDDLVRRLSAGAAEPPARRVPTPPQPPRVMMPEPPVVQPPPAAPDRVVVECANCKTPDFVSTLEGVVQHLSCSTCKSPYNAQFKSGVMRTTFQAKPTTESGSSAMKWILIGLVVLIVIVLALVAK